MTSINSKTIVFITGAFVSHLGWNHWIDYFESKGYTCYAPPWPYKEGTARELRMKQPNDEELALSSYKGVVDSYADFIKKLPEKPIVIGHSLGGLTTQLMIYRNLGAAGVMIHSVAPQGVLSFEWSFIKSIWKPLGYFTSRKRTHLMSLSEWQYAFTNGLSLKDQQESYDQSTIPESKTVLRDTLTSVSKVDFNKPHAPLLFISGSTDHIMPASLNYTNYKKYKDPGSITEYKEFEGHNHYVLGLPTWREEADYILNWIDKYSAPRELRYS
ncbi:alpha/beta hydrolase [Flavobacterium sp.]|uniref:alpha/beta hydrolase n=1 Tax=Flavobacterium sp. TaxID=239 RepID=UPI0039E576D1